MKPDEIRERLRATGRSQAALGRAIGAGKDSMSRLMRGSRRMSAEEQERIKAFFSGDETATPPFVKIPIYGYAAAGGEDRVAVAEDQITDEVEVPAGLVRGDVFGIRVVGDSMYPRLMSGEVLLVGRKLSPMRDRDCVVEFNDATAIVKLYKGQRDATLFLHQFNPDRELRFPIGSVKAVHAVIMRR